MPDRRDSAYADAQRQRIAQFFVLFSVIVGALVMRLAWWQLWPHPGYQPHDPDQQDPSERIAAIRGAIMDANGHPIVVSSYSYNVWVRPVQIEPEQQVPLAELLSEVLVLPYETVMNKLRTPTGSRRFLKGAGLPEKWRTLESKAIGDPETDEDDIDLTVLDYEDGYLRVCPDGDLAGVVLGFVNLEGESSYGLEQYYDKALRGQDGTLISLRGPHSESLMALTQGYRPPADGANLVLTLDRNVQYEAEQILQRAVREYGAEGGGLVIMEADTGAILALVDYPGYRPDTYWNYSDTRHRNDIVTSAYEPGSVIKPLTLAAALDAGVIEPTDTYNDRGGVEIGGRYLQNSDGRAHGLSTMTELLAYSLNAGAVHVAKELGAPRLYETFQRFGFGENTGIDLAGEQAGRLKVPGEEDWTASDLGTNSYGQGMSTTPIQVLVAYGALANEGLRMRPYLVGKELYPDRAIRHEPQSAVRVVSQDVAQEITAMMADAVEMGMQKAKVRGYRMAGKSGTANIPEPDGQGYSDKVIASFVGYGPLPDPRFVVLVKIDRPEGEAWGADVAAPPFAEMFAYLFDYYGIRPVD